MAAFWTGAELLRLPLVISAPDPKENKSTYWGKSLRTARSGDCNESVLAFRGKPFAGSHGALPDFLVRIIGADDGEKMAPLCHKFGIAGKTAIRSSPATRVVGSKI